MKLKPAGTLSNNETIGIFLLLSAMIYMLPLIILSFFDRYLISVLPFVAAGIIGVSGNFPGFTPSAARVFRFAAIALLLALSLFAICGTRDYMMWNRLRWEALHELTENKQVSAKDIDGGFEFNGWYLYDPSHNIDEKNSTKSFWWVQGDTYQICFQNLPGYSVIKEYRYFNLMPPHVGTVAVLQRKPEPLKN